MKDMRPAFAFQPYGSVVHHVVCASIQFHAKNLEIKFGKYSTFLKVKWKD